MVGRPDYSYAVAIRASDINLPIDIRTQTLSTLAIDIASQTLSQVDMNFKAQSVGVVVNAEWQEAAGEGVNLLGTATDVADGVMPEIISYTVPSGKTFYVDQLSWYGRATGAITCYLWNFTTNTFYFRGGANVGNCISFAKPIKVGVDGDNIRFAVGNYTGGTVSFIAGFIGGRLK